MGNELGIYLINVGLLNVLGVCWRDYILRNDNGKFKERSERT